MKASYQPPFSTANDDQDDQVVSMQEKYAYGEHVGKVGWLTMRTRPDIAFAVNQLQRRTADPRKQDLEALSQLLRYLKGAPDYGVQLAIAKDGLVGYVDYSYNDCEDGKSTEAYIFYYAGAPVSWSSQKQDIVATGSTVAEYIVSIWGGVELPCMHACCLLQTEPFDICLLFAICCLLQLSNVQMV
ncbi:hypothetical protein ACN38_g12729, partial [Penicillium nordicum]